MATSEPAVRGRYTTTGGEDRKEWHARFREMLHHDIGILAGHVSEVAMSVGKPIRYVPGSDWQSYTEQLEFFSWLME